MHAKTGVSLRVSDARVMETITRASATLRLTCKSPRVFDCLRNLKCLAHWWPGAQNIVALPPGVYGTGDVAVLQLRGENVGVLVIAYKPGRRIVLSLQMERSRLLVDLRVRAIESETVVELSFEAPRASTFLAQTVQQVRLRGLCRDAAIGLDRHLHASLAALHPNRSPDVTRGTSQ